MDIQHQRVKKCRYSLFYENISVGVVTHISIHREGVYFYRGFSFWWKNSGDGTCAH